MRNDRSVIRNCGAIHLERRIEIGKKRVGFPRSARLSTGFVAVTKESASPCLATFIKVFIVLGGLQGPRKY